MADEIPYASHSPGFKPTKEKDGCYCVLVTDDLEESLIDPLQKAADDFRGRPTHYVNHIDAGDLVHDQVTIVYFGLEAKVDLN
jgi:hypothetical protein